MKLYLPNILSTNEKKMCGTKKRFDTKDLAYHRKHKMESLEKCAFNVYQCPYCHYWHIGRKHENAG